MSDEEFKKMGINLKYTWCKTFEEYYETKTQPEWTKFERFVTTWDYLYSQTRSQLINTLINEMKRKVSVITHELLICSLECIYFSFECN